ncbi:AGE family epimerase/isomerase [Natronorubrum bangense]|uniref:Agl cluster protein AglQ n=2 Tax=Natronorubrum bangense TaxID=61858 RepID=L9WR29_9EURY|nr:hypothetical protein [Natronorubrum bangense]ELY51867.1 hypothetical protein C494_02001 [Natronorubrum bangense JCM 10635]QCC54902.1 hypothetical protein DV706_10760 [Natronorubrum bangense]
MSNSAPDSDGETITTYELLERSAESALELQREDGSFPPGRNYTYDEPETPVRTTSHWTMTLSEVYDITGKEKFQEAADAAVDYLLGDEIRPHGYTYYCRDASGKDHCNGLVGQAYPIRALAHAGLILERQDAIGIAEEVFTIHPFDEELGLWERVEIDGKKLSFDRTLNHQILFAAGSSKLASESNIVADRITTFLDRLPSNMELHSDGLIKHYARPSPIDAVKAVIRRPRHWPLLLNEMVFHYYSRSAERRKKEIGYQPVNLKGLAQLRMQFPEHGVWSNNKIRTALEAFDVDECSDIDYGSITPGMSFALAEYAFSADTGRIAPLIEMDLKGQLDHTTYLLTSDTVSDFDQSSTISILVELPDHDVCVGS